jgi:AcrR family transcriptional regulator
MAKARARFERDDWINLGLVQLAKHGPEALTLEQLTEAARKTRGSFYHHFNDHAEFLIELAERWLTRETDEVIALAEAAAPAGNRRETLARRAAIVDHALERQMRRLAAGEPAIAEIVAESDHRRIAYVAKIFETELALDPADALARARIQHCAFVGAQTVFPNADERFRLKHEATMKRTLWRK